MSLHVVRFPLRRQFFFISPQVVSTDSFLLFLFKFVSFVSIYIPLPGSLGPPPPVPRDGEGHHQRHTLGGAIPPLTNGSTPIRKGGLAPSSIESPLASTPGTPKPFVKSASARESSVLALIAGGSGGTGSHHHQHPLLAERKGLNGSSTSLNSSESFPSVSDGPTSPRHDSGW